jgi:copper resistance protein D
VVTTPIDPWGHPLGGGTHLRKRKLFTTTVAELSVIELVSLAWVGHAAASSGPFGIVQLLGDALHLLTSAFWPGALVPLAAFLLLLLTKVESSRGNRPGDASCSPILSE